jgi:cytoskeletal protein CcmA (bactofilin family)
MAQARTLSSSRLGSGTVIRGSIRGAGDLELAGRVEGTIEVDGDLTIEDSARIKSPVNGSRVVVRGAVLGDISGTESVILEHGAKVVGDLAAPSIGIRPGGLFRGHVASGDQAGTAIARETGARGTTSARRSAAEIAVRQPPARPAAKREKEQPVETAASPVLESRPRGRPARQAPAPVMPTIQKGAKAALKKKAR